MNEIYSSPWWLPGGHAQTLWGKLARRRRELGLTRSVIPTPDGDEVELHSRQGLVGAPQLLLLHGLEGTLRSHYVNGIVSAATDAGWTAHVLLFRSCGHGVNHTRRFYHSGDTDDLRLVVGRLLSQSSAADLYLVGVSLGGNVLLKYLGEDANGVPARVRAAAAISVPYDLARSAERINRGFSRTYQRFFLGSLKAKLLRKRRAFSDLPNEADILALRTMVAFDDLVTAPLHGFDSAADYYQRSSALGYLRRIRTPTLLLSAFDDPFLPADVLSEVELEARTNPALHIEFHASGGHVGFVGGAAPWRAEYYAEKRVLEFLSATTRPE